MPNKIRKILDNLNDYSGEESSVDVVEKVEDKSEEIRKILPQLIDLAKRYTDEDLSWMYNEKWCGVGCIIEAFKDALTKKFKEEFWEKLYEFCKEFEAKAVTLAENAGIK